MFVAANKLRLPAPHEALPGRSTPMPVPDQHYVTGANMRGPYPGMETALFGLGCFWGAEKRYWEIPSVHCTHVGYAGGLTPNPTYQEVCSGLTGHNEVVRVIFEPKGLDFADLLAVFWQAHDPTQGMRQGNDVGTQYRSGIYWYTEAQQRMALESRARYQAELSKAGYPEISTEILQAPEFYYAEEYHQQYLAKNPHGYCGLGGTNVGYPSCA